MARSRASEIDLNFDGLTDALTNLVGTLILFVFLLMAVTREKTAVRPPAPPPVFLPADAPAHARRSVDLLEEVAQLQAELQGMEAQTAAVENDIDMLRTRVAELARRAQSPPGKSP
jgi:hypothetical protein